MTHRPTAPSTPVRPRRTAWRRALGCAIALVVLAPPAAHAADVTDPYDQWMPSPPGATWTYRWTDAQYAPTPTFEQYRALGVDGPDFRLSWTTDVPGNTEGSVSSAGEIDYRRTGVGLVNLNWSSTPPPAQLPVLCVVAAGCANSLGAAHYMLIWGSRSPVLQEPLVQGARWETTGGVGNDVTAVNRYLGRERVAVTAFPAGVEAAKVESTIVQAGALGDPYGSGTRTVWWVRGVGPVKIAFLHTGGDIAQAELTATTLAPRRAPTQASYLPLQRGTKMRFRITNSKYLKRGAVQDVAVGDVVNNTARVDVTGTGAIRTTATYAIASRVGGLTALASTVRSSRPAPFPNLGPGFRPKERRVRLDTVLDFLTYGFGPILPGYPTVGEVWRNVKGSQDFQRYGVKGRSAVTRTEFVRTPIGRFRALRVVTSLRQNGFRFGTGKRTSWFAPGLGLVKLVFDHADHTTTTIERLK